LLKVKHPSPPPFFNILDHNLDIPSCIK
jgi:hypothetical protein